MAQSLLTATSASWVQAILLPQPPEYLGLQAHGTMPSQFFVFLVETGFHHVGQDGLNLWRGFLSAPFALLQYSFSFLTSYIFVDQQFVSLFIIFKVPLIAY